MMRIPSAGGGPDVRLQNAAGLASSGVESGLAGPVMMNAFRRSLMCEARKSMQGLSVIVQVIFPTSRLSSKISLVSEYVPLRSSATANWGAANSASANAVSEGRFTRFIDVLLDKRLARPRLIRGGADYSQPDALNLFNRGQAICMVEFGGAEGLGPIRHERYHRREIRCGWAGDSTQ